jgi:RNA polymerase sigma-70 factor (ECF subfamily)
MGTESRGTQSRQMWMTDEPVAPRTLVEMARAGDRDAMGRLLELYRHYLGTIAAQRLDSRLNQRFDASDLVQQTFLEAHQNFGRFAGSEEPELLAWLRRILRCNVANAIRDHFIAQKRALGLEQSLDAAGSRSVLGHVAVDASTPSVHAMRIEQTLGFLQAIEELPDDQGEAVRLRYLEGMSVAEIAEELGRSRSAAAGLVKRGMQALRRRLVDREV